MKLLIKNGTVIDPANRGHVVRDLWVDGGRIVPPAGTAAALSAAVSAGVSVSLSAAGAALSPAAVSSALSPASVSSAASAGGSCTVSAAASALFSAAPVFPAAVPHPAIRQAMTAAASRVVIGSLFLLRIFFPPTVTPTVSDVPADGCAARDFARRFDSDTVLCSPLSGSYLRM